MDRVILNTTPILDKSQAPYKNRMKILGNNFKNLGKKDKMNFYQIFNDQFVPQLRKTHNGSTHSPTAKSLKQTKNIFYIRFKQQQSIYAKKNDKNDGKRLPNLSRTPKIQRQSIFAYQNNKISQEESSEEDIEKGNDREDCFLEDLSNIEEHRKKLALLEKTRYNPHRNRTKFYFNTKKQMMLNPQLGFLMLDNNNNRYQKSSNFSPNKMLNTQLAGTRKTMFLSPQKTRKLSHLKNKNRNVSAEKEDTSKSQQVPTSMTGLTLDYLHDLRKKDKKEKEEMFAPWSISIDHD